MAMVLLFVVCGWQEEAVAGVCLRTYLVHFYIRFFGYQGYERRENCKPSCRESNRNTILKHGENAKKYLDNLIFRF